MVVLSLCVVVVIIVDFVVIVVVVVVVVVAVLHLKTNLVVLIMLGWHKYAELKVFCQSSYHHTELLIGLFD